ncbi:MAG: phage Gp37/Gp68 family protein [Pseudomonadota bacterium]|nr:phage Gp37/Gp68 family protein [Pseudomonadota bacterium]
MSDHTKIEWTDATWNVVTGCTVVSPGCTNCYAMGLAGTRLKHHPSRAGLTDESRAGPVWNGEVRFNEQWLDQPLRWRKPRNIFVCAHGDLFHPAVPDEWIDRVFAVMALAPHHRFQVLTKRADRMREYVTCVPDCLSPYAFEGERLEGAAAEIGRSLGWDHDVMGTTGYEAMQSWPLPNVWLGVSVEDQKRADERIPDLLATPAAVRWISAEPLLGPVDLEPWLDWPEGGCELPDGSYFGCAGCDAEGTACRCPNDRAYYDTNEGPRDEMGCPEWVHVERIKLDWVVVGGESGPNARPMHPDWARSLRDQCQAAGVAYFFKQWGAWAPGEIAGPNEKPIEAATWWDGKWRHERVGKADPDQHCDEEPDVFRIGKALAGRLLDGREWNEAPA